MLRLLLRGVSKAKKGTKDTIIKFLREFDGTKGNKGGRCAVGGMCLLSSLRELSVELPCRELFAAHNC